ncbi:carbohydrate porin [Microbaculum marinum]|uniref:Carbohydrate porin n=1 Tax=Microbaculum marinum TaxID=1764581 RepID=A0AAW9RGJ6_9HYPH
MKYLTGTKCASWALLLAFLLAGRGPSTAEPGPWSQSSITLEVLWDDFLRVTSSRPPKRNAPPESPTWGWLSGDWQAQRITGNWNGARDRLESEGISFTLDYLGQFAANPVGGVIEGGASWTGDWSLGLRMDLDRQFALPFPVYVTTSVGILDGSDALSDTHIGNVMDVQVSDLDGRWFQPKVVYLAVGAQLFDQTTEVLAGRIVTFDDFATFAKACTSMNGSICGNPVAGQFDITFPTDPDAVWGARVKVKPGDRWYAQAGAYLVYPGLGDPDHYGLEFGAPAGSGILAIGEAGLHVGHSANRPGLPGTYKAGYYYDTEELTNLSTNTSERNSWGIYGMAEQMLYSETDDYSQGLWGWFALSYAPPLKSDVKAMAALGLSYTGLLPHRPDDTLAFVAAASVFSEYLPGQSSEMLLELNYQAQLLPALSVQPGIQYIMNPSGYSTIEDAFVVGLNVSATF